MENYAIPTALMSGDIDSLSVPDDVKVVAEQLGANLVFNKQYHANHGTFCLGKDVTFFAVDALNLLQQYNPTSTEPLNNTFLSWILQY